MGLGASLLATRRTFGYAVLTICLPLAATGLTFDGLDESAGVSALFLTGSAIAFAVALCFPDYDDPAPAEPPLLSVPAAQRYGVRLGLAAAVGTAIAFYYGAEHSGWIVISTVIVMRPTAEMMKVRSAGRAVSVFIGALVAAWLLGLDLSPSAIALVGAGAIIAACCDQRQSVVHHTRIHDVPDLVECALQQPDDREHLVPFVGARHRHADRCRHRILLRAAGSDTVATSRSRLPRQLHRHPHDGMVAGIGANGPSVQDRPARAIADQ